MNAELLLEHFSRISEAPDAVPQLRLFILDLAVRGKLVEQDIREESATELLKRIQTEKHYLVKGGKIKKQEPISQIDDKDLPFQIPRGWIWARLATISLRIHYGFTASANKLIKSVRLLRITDIQNNVVDWSSVPGCEISEREVDQYKLRLGDILIARTGGTIGKTFLVSQIPVVAVFASYLIRVQKASDLYDRYLKLFLESPAYWKQLQEGARGAGQPNVNGQTLGRMIVAVPPLREQHRIVAKVDELMTLCDGLEAAQRELQARRDRLTASSHHFLSDGTNAEASRHANFFFNHLPRLTARPDQISHLRRTILNLAIRGQLIPQDPKDEPASVLLKRIKEEKALMVRDRKIRAPNPVPPMVEMPFSIPATWEWTRLGTLCFLITDGAHHTPKYEDEGVPFLSVKDVSGGVIDFSNTRHISKAAHQELCKRCRPEFGDILLTKVGTTGIAVTVDVETEFSIFVSLALLKFSKSNLNRFYLSHMINSPFVKRQSADNTQGIGNKNLVLRLINQFVVPIPPLAEQQRIVVKVDELMALCDRLEAHLTVTQEELSRLLGAVLYHSLNDNTPAATPDLRVDISESLTPIALD